MPTNGPFAQFVFVDFENVPSIDLSSIHGKPVHVTLLIGKQQRRVDFALLQQVHEHADQIKLIEVGVSGRNALDLVLAAHLGRASFEHPDAKFVVVSKDKDFDPLMDHLRANRINVTRVPDLSGLPAGSAGGGSPTLEKPARPQRARRRAPHQNPAAVGKVESLVGRLTAAAGPHPRNKARLLRHISSHFGNKLAERELEAVLRDLVDRGVVALDDSGHVSYPRSAG